MSFSLRRDLITRPIFAWAHKALPPMSDTEREALEAGDVWWDADLFTGNPDWSKLLAYAPATLTDEETAFLNGPVEQLCEMVDEWKVNWEWRDLPPEVWEFIKRNKFFGMIIPKEYGGLGFSPYAHSEVVRKISSRSVTAAVTVMVPNSLGPGELLMRFGTKEQQDKWLPDLAAGREIPCFGLTSPEAGSDAASMIDTGVICKGTFNGKETLGLRLNWHKRYITLGPVATLLGLAFKAYDPDHLIGREEELGITVALIPTDLPGVTIGHRHLPAMQVFQNGPNWGKDVFIPMDYIIGGRHTRRRVNPGTHHRLPPLNNERWYLYRHDTLARRYRFRKANLHSRHGGASVSRCRLSQDHGRRYCQDAENVAGEYLSLLRFQEGHP